MTLTEQIEKFAGDVLGLVNTSGIHPSVCKLILLDVIRDIERFEVSQKTAEEKENKES